MWEKIHLKIHVWKIQFFKKKCTFEKSHFRKMSDPSFLQLQRAIYNHLSLSSTGPSLPSTEPSSLPKEYRFKMWTSKVQNITKVWFSASFCFFQGWCVSFFLSGRLVCFMASHCLFKSTEHDRPHANVIWAPGNILEQNGARYETFRLKYFLLCF